MLTLAMAVMLGGAEMDRIAVFADVRLDPPTPSAEQFLDPNVLGTDAASLASSLPRGGARRAAPGVAANR